jgi:chorismate dehydratase
MAKTIRIGAVGYLNSRPLVVGLEQDHTDIELSYAVPAVLADRLAAGELDIALLPVIELAAIADLEVVPGLGITTRGAARSVQLVTHLPIGDVRSVALDPESRTSNALVQVLFADVWQTRPTFAVGPCDLDRALRDCDAAVRIGDKALFEPPGPGRQVHDLGSVWTRATGLPFVFAVWAARAGIVDRRILRLLHEARRMGVGLVDRLAREFTWRGQPQRDLARRYLRDHIHYALGEQELAAMARFLEAAARVGLIDRPPQIRLALEDHSRPLDRVRAEG